MSDVAVVKVSDPEGPRVKVTVLDRGPRGPQGPASIALGTVTVVNPDVQPDVSNAGTLEDVVLDVSLPRAPQVTVGTVTTVPAGDPAAVTDVGTDGDVVLDFELPAGEQGVTWRGEWDAGTTYDERDVVRHRRAGEDRASSYIALEGSTGVEPPAPGDAPTAEWDVLAAGGVDGGGAETLTELADVDTTGSAAGDALVFDAVTGLWGPGSSASALDDLDDVDVDDPADGDVLAYDDQAGEWVASGAYPTLVNTDDDPGMTIYVGTVDPSTVGTPVDGDVWIEVPE